MNKLYPIIFTVILLNHMKRVLVGATLSRAKKLPAWSSIYLDMLRIIAALTVFFYHIYFLRYPNDNVTHILDKLSHLAVIVFFVISGFVIAYTSSSKISTLNNYLIVRLSKLFSVVLPALMITGIIQFILKMYFSNILGPFVKGLSFSHYMISGVFCNEIWFYSAAPALNTPLWSLSYEFWYYIIFGLFYYRSGGFKSLVPGILACVVAGPKILLLMPIWLFGYFAYTLSPRINIKSSVRWIIVFCILLITAVLIKVITPVAKLGVYPLVYANQFSTDWIIGFSIALSFCFLPLHSAGVNQFFYKAVRAGAELTFPLYVLHFPLIILWDTVFNTTNEVLNENLWQVIVGVLIISCGIGLLLDKYRYLWARLKYRYRIVYH